MVNNKLPEILGTSNTRFLRDERTAEVYEVKNINGSDVVRFTKRGKQATLNDPRLLEVVLAHEPGPEYLIWDSWTNQPVRPGLRSQIFRNTVKKGPFGLLSREVAIKQPLPGPEGRDSTAIEQFDALEGIRAEGFLVVPVLLATKNTNRLVLEWFKGKHPSEKEQEQLDEFTELLDSTTKRLETTGRWKSKWGVERQPRNYFIGNLGSTDKRKHFYILDPVSGGIIIMW